MKLGCICSIIIFLSILFILFNTNKSGYQYLTPPIVYGDDSSIEYSKVKQPVYYDSINYFNQ